MITGVEKTTIEYAVQCNVCGTLGQLRATPFIAHFVAETDGWDLRDYIFTPQGYILVNGWAVCPLCQRVKEKEARLRDLDVVAAEETEWTTTVPGERPCQESSSVFP